MAVSAEEESSAADMVGDMAEGLKRVVMVADMEVDGAKRSGVEPGYTCITVMLTKLC